MSVIVHSGKVLSVASGKVLVSIISESACSSCHAAGLCGMSESKEKQVEANVRSGDSFYVGEQVNVLLQSSMGHKAVWLAYVIPLVILVSSLMVALGCGTGELLAGVVACAASAAYYFVLWLLRGKLQNSYVFVVDHKL